MRYALAVTDFKDNLIDVTLHDSYDEAANTVAILRNAFGYGFKTSIGQVSPDLKNVAQWLDRE